VTQIALTLTAGGILGVNLQDKIPREGSDVCIANVDPDPSGQGSYGWTRNYAWREYGFPWIFVVSTTTRLDGQSQGTDIEVKYGMLALNIVAWLIGLAGVGVACEWTLRR
jgi:hypothetical protein